MIIDGRRWVQERLRHLDAALAGDDLDDGQRRAVEEERDRLQAELGQTNRRRWLRWLGGPRL